MEGQVSVASQPVDAKSIGSVELEPGQSLATGAGKAELLLTPGVFFRVGDNSSARMISPNLTDTEVELVHGNALVEVTDLYRENNLRVIEDGKSTQLVKNGLYDFDADHDQVRVFDGQAVIQDGNKQVKIKAGHEVSFNDEPLKTQKFDKKSFESSDLYRWTSLRSSYLAEANVDAARTYVPWAVLMVWLRMVLGSVVQRLHVHSGRWNLLQPVWLGILFAGIGLGRSVLLRRTLLSIISPATTALGVRDITMGSHTTMEMECATEHGQRRELLPFVAEPRHMGLAAAALQVADSTAAEASTVKWDLSQMLVMQEAEHSVRLFFFGGLVGSCTLV